MGDSRVQVAGRVAFTFHQDPVAFYLAEPDPLARAARIAAHRVVAADIEAQS